MSSAADDRESVDRSPSPSQPSPPFARARTRYTSNYTSILYPGAGLARDVQKRWPYYAKDWLTGLNYRTFAGTLRIYFLNLIPALAYIQDMYDRTDGNYGVNEALLSTALGGIVFGVLSVQPLTIVGITGLINLFNYTTFDIITRYQVPYLPFMGWVAIWAALAHWLIALFNLTSYVRYVTDFTAQTFGFYVGIVYIQKGIELILKEFDQNARDGFMSTVIAFAFFFSYWSLTHLSDSKFGHRHFRTLLSDSSMAICVVFWSGFAQIPGTLKDSQIQRLPITRSFFPTLQDRSWFVPFYQVSVGYVFVALPFGLLVTALFYFDHNVSSISAQAKTFPLKRPAGFHWDFFLLGWTTLVAGFLGIPYPNALVPQAPMHTDSLCVFTPVHDDEEKEQEEEGDQDRPDRAGKGYRLVLTEVKEQRVSNTVQGLLALGTMTRPLLVAIGLIPRAVLAGVFLGVGWGAIEGNKITSLTLYLCQDRNLVHDHPLCHLRRRKILAFVSLMWLGFGLTIAISQTIAAIGFPLLILALIPVRAFWMTKWFSQPELDALDSPVASGLPLDSIGGMPREIMDAAAREAYGRQDSTRRVPKNDRA